MGKRKNLRKTDAARPVSQGLFHALLIVIVLFSALPRVRLRDLPLERDEGEYAYAGQLLLQGIPAYKLAYNMKLPGTYAAYAVIMGVFGETPAGIHIGLLLVNAATTVLIFFLARRLWNAMAGVVAAASYTILATSPSVLGFAGHATHFVVLAAVSGTLLLLRALDSGRLWLFLCSGALFGTAFLMKQPGIFFVLFGLLYLVKREWRPGVGWGQLFTRLLVFSCGAAFPFGLTCLLLWRAGVFHRFWFWTFTYARHYGSIVILRDAPGVFWEQLQSVAGPAVFIWILGAVGLIAVFWSRQARGTRWFVAGFLLFSFLAVCPGFYFRAHYFIVQLPAIALLAGVAVSLSTEALRNREKLRWFRFVPALALLVALAITINEQSEFLFEMDPLTACRSMYGNNPFPEALPIADFLKTHTSPSASIGVLGSEPEIYFYSHRHSATGYIYAYPMMENQPYALDMQKEIISEVEKAQPDFLLVVSVPTSWLARPDSRQLVFDWAQKYLTDRYQLAGIVDILPETQYRWGEEAASYNPVSPDTVQIFRRRSNSPN